MKYRLSLFTILLIAMFSNYNVFAKSFKIAECSEGNYIRAAAGSNEKLTDVDNVTIVLPEGHRVEILSTVKYNGADWYKIYSNYYSNNYTGYINSKFFRNVRNINLDDNYENQLRNNGFPDSYIAPISKLHALYPNIVFTKLDVGSWDEILNGEVSQVDRNLIQSPIEYLRSTNDGSYSNGKYRTYDNGSWYAASRQTVGFYMDPRNWLSEYTAFMFEGLSFNDKYQSESNIQKMLDNTFLSGNYNGRKFANIFYGAGHDNNISSIHLASRVIQEQGSSGGGVYKFDDGNACYYNYFNISASGNSKDAILANSKSYAKRNGWTDPVKSIYGGAKLLSSEYINSGQDSIYLEKYNVTNKHYYHQYQQNVRAAVNEAITTYYSYKNNKLLNNVFELKIPVFTNMPSSTSLSLSDNGNNTLKSISVDKCNLNPSFDSAILSYYCDVDSSVGSVNINADAISSLATVLGNGNISLNSDHYVHNIEVTASNGDKKNYQIVFSKVSAVDASPNDVISKLGLNIDGSYITKIGLNTQRNNLIQNLKDTFSFTNVTYKNSSGNIVNSGNVATGDKISISINGMEKTYTVVIKGDVNGDGLISSVDYSRIKAYFQKKYNLNGEYFKASDIDGNGTITSVDYSRIKAYFLGKYNIE